MLAIQNLSPWQFRLVAGSMAPLGCLDNELSVLSTVALASWVHLERRERLLASWQELWTRSKGSLSSPYCFDLFGVIETFGLLICFFLHLARWWGMEWVGEVMKVNTYKISRRLFKVVDCIAQKCLWINQKLSPKYSHKNARKWWDTQMKQSGVSCGVSLPAFRLASYLSGSIKMSGHKRRWVFRSTECCCGQASAL